METDYSGSTANSDSQNTFTLASNEKVKGKVYDFDGLTLFKKFLIGNSGQLAADTFWEI